MTAINSVKDCRCPPDSDFTFSRSCGFRVPCRAACELFAEQLAVFLRCRSQTARPVLVIGNRQILFDRHVKGRTLEWILKHAADLSGALVFRLFGDVPAVQ